MSVTKIPVITKKESHETQLRTAATQNQGGEVPNELVLRMAKTSEDRRCSHVRWSIQRDIFRTGNYPQLAWNLYDCHPGENKDVPPTPDVFFRTVKDLGHGSFGSVKLVELKLSGERLAMKVMDKEQCPRTLRMKELHAFIQIGMSPFIVRFHSCFQTETACYLLMQYHCGGSLAKIVEEFGLLCEDTARDIKLANILLGIDNHVRICDLGLCKLGMMANMKTHTRCGALRYCAPEVLSREWYSKEVDWWSLGVVLYRLLTGQYPFDAPSRDVIEEMIKNEEPNLTLVSSGAASDLITKFLRKNCEERLGAGDNAEPEIRSHPFFQEIKWEQLQGRKIRAPSVQKRFMRRGSIIRKLAFGVEDPKASRTRMIVGRVFQVLLRLLVLSAIVGLVIIVTNSERRHSVLAFMAHLYLNLKVAVGSAKLQLENAFQKS